MTNSSEAKKKTTVDDCFVELRRLMNIEERICDLIEREAGKSEPSCMVIVGPTGIGKSHILTHTFKGPEFLPQRTSDGWVRPLVRVQAPQSVTVKTMTEVILKELDDGEFKSRDSIPQLVSRTTTQLRGQKTKLLVIDEAQGLLRGTYAAGDFIKTILNAACCPVLLVGLPSTLELLTENRQLDGRSWASVILNAYDWSDIESRKEFRAVLAGIQDQVEDLQSAIPLSDMTIAAALHFACGGLLRELRQLLNEAILMSQRAQTSITVETLARAYDMRKVNPRFNPFRQPLPESWEPASLGEGLQKKTRKKAA